MLPNVPPIPVLPVLLTHQMHVHIMQRVLSLSALTYSGLDRPFLVPSFISSQIFSSVLLCPVLSYNPILSYLAVSCSVLSIPSCPNIYCPVLPFPYHIQSCPYFSSPVLSFFKVSCLILPIVFLSCPFLSCLVQSCLVLSGPALSCPVPFCRVLS